MQVALYLVSVIIAFTVVAICWTLWMARRRTRQLSTVASALGFSFQAKDSTLLDSALGEVPLFALASICLGTVSNVLRGSADEMKITILDCEYRTGGTARPSEQREYRQTVACFSGQGLASFTLQPSAGMPPHFALGTAAMLAGIGQRFSGGDARWQMLQQVLRRVEEPGIEFDTNPMFNRLYRLQSSEGDSVRRLFRPAVLDALVQQVSSPFSIEAAAGWLVIYRHKKLVKPSKLAEFVQQVATVARLLVSNGSRS